MNTIHVSRPRPDLIQLMVRIESGDRIGDLVEDVRPGETVDGKTFDQWSDIVDLQNLAAGHGEDLARPTNGAD